MQTFRLIPYPVDSLPKIDIIGEISRTENQLSIRYKVTGDIDQISLPPSSTSPSRKDGLWKATCFEFFIAIPDQPQYWEFNMSPSGDWNVYIMDEYRRVGFREEISIKQIQFEVWKEASEFFLNANVGLNPIIHHDDTLNVGITAVIQTKDKLESYWALAHPGLQADFHLREGFLIHT